MLTLIKEMKKIKKYIIIVSIIIVLILVSIIGTILYIKNKELQEQEKMQEEYESHIGDITEDIVSNMEILKDNNTYFSIEKMVKDYYLYIKSQNEEAIFSLLNEDYKEKNEINQENVLEKIKLENENDVDIKINEIYRRQSNLEYATYFMEVSYIKNTSLKNFYILCMDNTNGTFNIRPISKEEYNDYISERIQIIDESIEKNNYNAIKQFSLTEEDVVMRIFEDYIQNALYSPEDSYNSLELEYREKKFGNFQAFQRFLDENKEIYESYDMKNAKKYEDFTSMEEYMLYLATFQQIKLESYEKTIKDEYTQYVCIDNLKNYYIFRETAAMQYTVILDTYTIDLPEFVEQYEKASEEDKVLMNIQKFFEAIEDKDYNYAYNKLDATFKANNFATLESFEKYVRENFFEENTLSAGKAEKQGDVYLYNVTIDDGTGESSNSKTTSFVMRLGEETDFVMSFEVE